MKVDTGAEIAFKAVVQNLGMRVGYITLGGFDTHREQAGTQDKLLALLASKIQAPLADLKAHGRSQDVAVMTWSEFGRRAQENGNLPFQTDFRQVYATSSKAG